MTAEQDCINIGPKQRQLRLRFGAISIAIGFVGAIVFVFMRLPPVWSLALLLFTWSGSISLFQVKEKTCVALARLGLRDLDDGRHRVKDPAEDKKLRQQARKVYAQGAMLAFALQSLFWIALTVAHP